MIALGRSPIVGVAVPYPALPADAVSRGSRGRGRTSGVPVSGSEMTWVARPRTTLVFRVGAGSILGGLS